MPCVMLIKEIKNRYKNNRIIVVSTTKDKSYEILNIKNKLGDKVVFKESDKADKYERTVRESAWQMLGC